MESLARKRQEIEEDIETIQSLKICQILQKINLQDVIKLLEELNIAMTIDVKNKILYIGEENSSGVKYKYNNVKDLEDKIKFYLEYYYLQEIEYGNDKKGINNELEDEEEIL